MKLVHTAFDVPNAQIIKQLLEDNGIAAVVEGERLYALRGDMPTVYPTIWVSNDSDLPKACEIIGEFTKRTRAPIQRDTWMCPKCHELNESQFSECWSCAKALEDGPRAPDPLTRKLKTALAAALFLALGCGFLSFFLSELLPADLSASQRWLRQLVSLTRLFAMFFCIIAFYFIVKLAQVPKKNGAAENQSS